MSLDLANLTKDQESILLFCETQLVDNFGRLDSRKMNEADFAALEEFQAAGLLKFGRIKMGEIRRLEKISLSAHATHWVSFTDAAWDLAQKHRRIRSVRTIKRKTKEAEKRGETLYGDPL